MSNVTLIETTVVEQPSARQILIVDDAMDVAETLQFMLAQAGHEGEVCTSSRDALTRFKPGKYDLVVTDYSMPGMNGIELAEIMRRRAPRQRILMVTAFAFTIAAYDGRPLPVSSVLHKPFKQEEFQDAINQVLSAVRKRH